MGPVAPPNRFVTFCEVTFGKPQDWLTEGPDHEGFISYTHQGDVSTITITRTDGKVLSFDVIGIYLVQIRENFIKFFGAEGDPSGGQFH